MRLELTSEERDLLIQILDRTLGETRSEVRRTREPSFHDALVAEAERLRGLLRRLREPESAPEQPTPAQG